MKKLSLLKTFVILLVAPAVFLTTSFGIINADVISPGEKQLSPCISIINLDEFSEYDFYVIARGPLQERFPVSEDTCVTWYKFNSDIYIEAKSKANSEETAISKRLDVEMARTVSIFSSETGTQYNFSIDKVEGNEVYVTQVSTESNVASDSSAGFSNSLLPVSLVALVLLGSTGVVFIVIRKRKN